MALGRVGLWRSAESAVRSGCRRPGEEWQGVGQAARLRPQRPTLLGRVPRPPRPPERLASSSTQYHHRRRTNPIWCGVSAVRSQLSDPAAAGRINSACQPARRRIVKSWTDSIGSLQGSSAATRRGDAPNRTRNVTHKRQIAQHNGCS